jgi:hypothetical protein
MERESTKDGPHDCESCSGLQTAVKRERPRGKNLLQSLPLGEPCLTRPRPGLCSGVYASYTPAETRKRRLARRHGVGGAASTHVTIRFGANRVPPDAVLQSRFGSHRVAAPVSGRERHSGVVAGRLRSVRMGSACDGRGVLGARVAVVTVLIGGSVVTYTLAAGELPLLSAIAVGIALVFVLFLLGACSLFRRAYAAAVRFAPSWERLQQRADTLWALYEAESGSENHAAFRARFAASHSVAAQQDLDNAAKAGYPLIGITRDEIRRATLSDLPTIAQAFDEAAGRFRKVEEE